MNLCRVKKVSVITIALVALSMGAGTFFVKAAGPIGATARVSRASVAAPAPAAMPLGLPSEDTAKSVLDASLPYHHPQWVDVTMGSAKIRTFVIYPDLAGKLPVVLVTAKGEGLSDWVRAVGTEVVNEGFIAVVPDLLSGLGPNGGGRGPNAAGRARLLAQRGTLHSDAVIQVMGQCGIQVLARANGLIVDQPPGTIAADRFQELVERG